jgi:palmitoyltransferase
MTILFEVAVPSLERRCFNILDPSSPDYEASYEVASGTLIAKHGDSLIIDLRRLTQFILIATNVLTVGEIAQNHCSDHELDKAVFRLISVCVKVTARGYDGETGTADEEKWQAVVNICK